MGSRYKSSGDNNNKYSTEHELGRLVTLRPITGPVNNNNNKSRSKSKVPKTDNTRIIRISESLYKKFVDHSIKYYNTETYETILENLLKCYDEHNQDKRYCYWWDNNGNN